MNMTSLTLLWLAGYSNVTSIVVIILSFLVMTIFIGFVSTNWDSSERTNIATGVEERNMIQVCNPFFIKLSQNSKKLKDGISLQFSSLCPSKLFVLWGVKINQLHDFILKPGVYIQEALEDTQTQAYVELGALHYDTLQFPVAGNHEVNLACPVTVNSDTLGTMPRKRYPVAIFSLLSESCDSASRESKIQPEGVDKLSIIGLISVIHLQDDRVVQPSHIIGQFVKTSGIQLYSLQPLFLSSALDGTRDETFNSKNRCDEKLTQQDQTSTINTHEDLKTTQVDSKLVDSTKHVCSQESSSQSPSTLDTSEPVIRRRNVDISHESVVTATNNSNISEQSLEENPSSYSENSKAPQPECVVCQTRPVMCALLPCRHACVCLGCFKLLDRCPMCRGSLESYFLLGDKDDFVEEESSLHDLQQQAVSEHFTQYWERLNERLNAFFGIR